LTENNLSPRIPYPARLSFKNHRAIKIYYYKQKLKHYLAAKPPLQKILQEFTQEDESKRKHERKGSIKPQEKKR
jgi:hypothetical protein